MRVYENPKYDPCFSSRRPALDYAPALRARAVKCMAVHAAEQRVVFYECDWLLQGFEPDDLAVYGLLRALEWLSLGVPLANCSTSSGYLKFLTENVAYDGARPLEDFPRLGYGQGVYVANDISTLAVLASGVRWRPNVHARAGVTFAASFPARCKGKPMVNCFPRCLHNLVEAA